MRAVLGHSWRGLSLSCFPKHSAFSFIWFFKTLAACSPCCCSFPIWTFGVCSVPKPSVYSCILPHTAVS